MKAKVINLHKPKEVSPEQLTVEQCRKLFKTEEYTYSDEELILMRNFLFKLSKIYYELYMTSLRHKAKVVPLNKTTNGTEKSNHIRPGEHRRAS